MLNVTARSGLVKMDEIQVKLTAIDEVTPKLQQIRRELWWIKWDVWVYRHTAAIMILTVLFIFVVGFLLGRVS